MKTSRFLFLFFFSLISTVQAQTTSGNVSGKITGADGKSMPFATIMLMKSPAKTLAKGAVTDTSGVYLFNNIPAGSYYISASFVGYQTKTSEVFTVDGGARVQIPTLALAINEASTQVTVTAQRQLIQVEPDRVTMNVEGTVNSSGSNGLELLQKAPGVTVDNDDNISLQGRNSVKVYIDGRPSPLSGKDLANFLRSLQSSSVDKIDLITNPSAKYDASGNAGIIDIRLKRNTSLGTNGTFTLGANQGWRTRYNENISLNNRSEKLNVFGTFGHNGGQNENKQTLYRIQANQLYDQTTNMLFDYNNASAKLGADYVLNNKKTMGVMADLFYNDALWTSDGKTLIGAENGPVDQILVANNRSDMNRMNGNLNFNYRFSDTKAKTDFNVDFDRGFYRNRGNTYQPNAYKNPTETQTLFERIYKTETPTDINIYTLKADYTQPFKKNGKLDLGFKSSLVRTDNTFDFWDVVNGQDVKNLDRSNHFDYTENINAVYANLNKRINPKFSLQAGLRLEQTNSVGELTSATPQNDDRVERHYLNAFPTAALSYQVNPKNMVNLNYSRRIDRPSYQQLNPFENKLDELMYQKGNAFLKPQFTHKVDLVHTYKWRYVTTFSYSNTRDFFTQIMDTTEVNRTYITQKNLARQEVVSLNMGLPFQIKKGWQVYANANFNRQHYVADFGTDRKINTWTNNYNLYAQNTIAVAKSTTIEISGFYNSPFIWGGTFKGKPLGSLDLGVSQKLFSDRGTLKLNVSDVLGTLRFHGESDFAGLKINVGSNWEARQVRLNFTYRFGSNEVKGARQRKTSSEDEARRSAGGNGGGGVGIGQ